MKDLISILVKALAFLKATETHITSEEKAYRDSAGKWRLNISYSKRRKHIFLDINISHADVSLENSPFELYNQSMSNFLKLIRLDITRLQQDGRSSKMSDAYCSAAATPRLLDIKGSRLGWKDKSITYTANFNNADWNNLSGIFGDLKALSREAYALFEIE